MVAKVNSAEGGTDGTTVTVGNSGGASGDAWGSVTIAGTLRYENTSPFQGAMCYELIPTSGGQTYLGITETAADSMMVSMFLKFPTLPAATGNYLTIRNGTGQAAGIQVLSTGRVSVVNAAGSVLGTSAVGEVITTATWYRFELRVLPGTTTSNGTIQGAFYLGNGTSPIWSYSSSAVNSGTTQLTNARLGRSSVEATTPTHQIDAVQWWTAPDTPSALGQPWAVQRIVGLAASKVSSSSANVTWTDVTDAPDGYDVARVPGTVTLDGSGRDYLDPDFDPLTMPGVIVVSTADAGSPFLDTGMTPGDYTYYVVRTAP